MSSLPKNRYGNVFQRQTSFLATSSFSFSHNTTLLKDKNHLISGFALSIAIVAKCDKKIIVAQDFFIWRKCMATTLYQVTKIQLTDFRQQ